MFKGLCYDNSIFMANIFDEKLLIHSDADVAPIGSGLMAPNAKHDFSSSFHRPSPVVGTASSMVPPHGSSVHFGFEDRSLTGSAFSDATANSSRRRQFPSLSPLVIGPPAAPPPSMFDLTQSHTSAPTPSATGQ